MTSARFESSSEGNPTPDIPKQVVVFQGDDVSQLMQLLSNDQPVDLTGATAITITLQNDLSIIGTQGSPTVVATLANSKISIETALLGLIALELDSTDTASLLPLTRSNLDIQVVDSNGKQQTYRICEAFSVNIPNN